MLPIATSAIWDLVPANTSKVTWIDADPILPGLLHRSAPMLLVSWEVSDGVVRPRANPSCPVKVLDGASLAQTVSMRQ